MSASSITDRSRARPLVVLAMALATGLSLGGCEQRPPPRTFIDFLDDPIARDGALLRCNQDREASMTDGECIDARRAAAAVAAREDEARRQALERESERKREALRAAETAQRQRELEAQRAAAAAAEAAYEAQWTGGDTDPTPPAGSGEPAPAAAPESAVAPESAYADPSQFPSTVGGGDAAVTGTGGGVGAEPGTLQPPGSSSSVAAGDDGIPRPFRRAEPL